MKNVLQTGLVVQFSGACKFLISVYTVCEITITKQQSLSCTLFPPSDTCETSKIPDQVWELNYLAVFFTVSHTLNCKLSFLIDQDCGDCGGSYGECESDTCDGYGWKTGSKTCWEVNFETGENMPGTDTTEPCEVQCTISCRKCLLYFAS